MEETPKITICFISFREPYEVVLENFSKALLSYKNYEMTLLGCGEMNSKPFASNQRRKLEKLHVSKKIRQKLRIIIYAFKVIKFLNKNKFSIVHMDSSCGYFGLIKLLARNDAKFIFHILSFPVSTSKITRFKRMLRIYLQCLLINKIVVQSSEIKEHWFGINKLNYAKVIPVGIDKNTFYPIERHKVLINDELDVLKSSFLIVYSGVISKQRNLDKLVFAMSLVLKTYKDAKLLMVGGGEATDDLKNYAKSLKIEQSLVFVGHVSHNKVVHYLNIADVAISYVPVTEGYNYNPPLKTFEYLACGLPTVATNTISNQKIIKNGENGILVNDTSKDVAAAIIDLFSNPDKRKYIRKNARNSILNFDYKLLTEKYLIPLYEDVLVQ